MSAGVAACYHRATRVSGIPKDIPDFGATSAKPRQNSEFAPGVDFTTEDYFVWSRCDGATSVRELILMVGFGTDRTVAILRKLRRQGAVLLDGESPADVASRLPRTRSNPERRRARTRADDAEASTSTEADHEDVDLGELSAEEAAAMAEDVALDDLEKRRVIAAMRRVRGSDYFELLGVDRDADRRVIKRAYFRLSKAFHPDRHYGQDVGSFGPWFAAVFESVTRAFDVLSDSRQRAAYEARLRGEAPGDRSSGQTRTEHAAELFQRACDLEHSGDRERALELFAAALRGDEHPRYLRRAAMCARSAGKLSDAERYAKKAAELRPGDPSSLRVLADVYRAADRFLEAEATLVKALDLRTENDVLVGELKSDLAAVRAALASEGA